MIVAPKDLTDEELKLVLEIIRLANVYCRARGLPPTRSIYFSQRAWAWATVSEDAGQDVRLGKTLTEAHEWLRQQVNDAG